MLSLLAFFPLPSAVRTLAASAAVVGVSASSPARPSAGPARRPLATAVLAAGCFWTAENVFEHVRGVVDVVSGFATGSGSDHVEAVRITYDSTMVSYDDLLRVFFLAAHDPTQRDRQGPDVGAEYRSVVFVAGAAQRSAARRYMAELVKRRVFARPIVTEVDRLTGFHEAPPAHQDYALEHPTDPYIVYNDTPKLDRLRTTMPTLYQERLAAARPARAKADR